MTTTVDTTQLTGISGRKYEYWVYDPSAAFNPGQDGNYAFADVEDGFWRLIYVGQGDICDRKAEALAAGCVKRKGARYFLCHLNRDKAAREAEEADLILGHRECLHPQGCNRRVER